VLLNGQLKESLSIGCEFEPLRIGLVAGTLEMYLLGARQPVSVAEGVAAIVEAAVAAVVVHALEEGRALTNFEAIADEHFREFFQIILNLRLSYFVFRALWVAFQQPTAPEVREVVLELVLLRLNLEQRALSCIVTNDTLHAFQIRLYSQASASSLALYSPRIIYSWLFPRRYWLLPQYYLRHY